MTLEEKVSAEERSSYVHELTACQNNLTYGIDSTDTSCVGAIGAITRLGFPGLCLQDAGNGVRMADFVNSYPSGIHVGARYENQ